MSTKAHTTPAVVAVDEVTSTAGKIFRKLRYSGDDGRDLWKAAALLHLGKISEAELWDSVAGTIECDSDCPPKYFYRCLRECMEKRGADLQVEMKSIRIMPTWPSSAPDGLAPVPVLELPATWQDPTPMPW